MITSQLPGTQPSYTCWQQSWLPTPQTPSKQIAQVSSLETWIFRRILEVDRKKTGAWDWFRRFSDDSCLIKWILLCLLPQRSQTKWDVVSTRVQQHPTLLLTVFGPWHELSTYLWLKKTSKNPAPFQRWTRVQINHPKNGGNYFYNTPWLGFATQNDAWRKVPPNGGFLRVGTQ